jgi:hypothetical protein
MAMHIMAIKLWHFYTIAISHIFVSPELVHFPVANMSFLA